MRDQQEYFAPAPAPEASAPHGTTLPRLSLPEHPFSRRLRGAAAEPIERPALGDGGAGSATAIAARPSAPDTLQPTPSSPAPTTSSLDMLPPPTGLPVGAAPQQTSAPAANEHPQEASPHPAVAADQRASVEAAWSPGSGADMLGGVFAAPTPVAHAAVTPAAWAGQFAGHPETQPQQPAPVTPAWQHQGDQAPAMRLGPPAPLDAVPGHRPAPRLASIRTLSDGGRLHAALAIVAAMAGGFALLLAKVSALAPITEKALGTALVLSLITLAWSAGRLRSIRDDARILPGGAAWAVRGAVALLPAAAASFRFGLMSSPAADAGAISDAVGSVAASLVLVAAPLAIAAAVAMLIRHRLSAAHQPQLVAGTCAAMLIGTATTAMLLVSLLMG